MNHKAFTLVELLAVIVILAIIVMIAIPQVNETIESADKNSLLVSAKNIVRTIEYGIVNGTIPDGELIFDGTNKPIQTTKKITETGNILIENKKISLNLCNTQYCVNKSFSEKEMTVTEKENFNEIKKIEDLITLSNEVNAGDKKMGEIYVLQNDLDFLNQNSYYDYQTTEFGDVNKNGTVEELMTELTTGTGFPSIGLWRHGGDTEETYYSIYYIFSGTFDGQNNSIVNLYLKSGTDYGTGFFGIIENSKIKNLNLEGTATTSRSFSSLFAEYALYSSFTNCTVEGTLTINDSNLVDVDELALLLSYGHVITLENCHANGDIISNNDPEYTYSAGLLFGDVYSDMDCDEEGYYCTFAEMSKVFDSSAEGTISGIAYYTGLFASSINGDIYNSYAKGSLTSTHTFNRGLAGFIGSFGKGTLLNNYSDVDVSAVSVTGNSELGGLTAYIGWHEGENSGIKIANCYTKGSITGSTETGGFIGQNGPGSEGVGAKYATAEKFYSLTDVTVSLQTPGGAGGLVGLALMDIKDAFFAGSVTAPTIGSTRIGPIIGAKANVSSTFNNSYYKENSIITGTHNTFGTIATLDNLKSEEWYRNILNFDDNFQYNDGYYPILYKIDPDTLLPTKILMPNQELIEVK